MRGRPRKNRTEAERLDFRLESSKMSHAKGRPDAWYKKHAAPSRTSSKPPTTLDELCEAYGRRNVSCEAMIRFREAIELDDPNPASLVFDGADEAWLVPVREKAIALLSGCSRSFCELAKRIAVFGQQSGLCPEPRLDEQYAHAVAERGIGAVEGVRGNPPPVDVGKRHGA